jgi:hypothetical protein
MFANQALKCINEFIDLVKQSSLKIGCNTLEEFTAKKKEIQARYDFLNEMKLYLMNSVHFYLGNYSSWYSQIEKEFKEAIISPFHNKNLILPFRICTFHYSVYNYDIVAITYKTVLKGDDQNDHPVFVIRFCIKTSDGWFPSMIEYTYLLDKVASEVLNPKTIDTITDVALVKKPEIAAVFIRHATESEEEQKFHLQYHQLLKDSTFVIAFGLKYLQCKNVTSEYIYKTKSSKEFNIIPKEDKELFRYKVLKVMVPKNRKKYVYDEKMEPKMTTMPVHIVMAHEKTYTKEKPLFGKYVGSWLWQDFTRGTPENGFITKDYCIKQR